MGRISATKLRGSRKQEVEFLIRNETGSRVFRAIGEVETLKFDKRRKKSRDYVTLSTLSQEPRFDLTYNLSTHQISIMYRGGVHFAFFQLSAEPLAKIYALQYLRSHMSKSYDKLTYDENAKQFTTFIKYYSNLYDARIKAARKKRFASWNKRKAKKRGPQVHNHKTHSD